MNYTELDRKVCEYLNIPPVLSGGDIKIYPNITCTGDGFTGEGLYTLTEALTNNGWWWRVTRAKQTAYAEIEHYDKGLFSASDDTTAMALIYAVLKSIARDARQERFWQDIEARLV